MTDRVASEDIERIVGASRHPTEHIMRLVSSEERAYILHSAECVEEWPDLRECPYSTSLDDYGIREGLDDDEGCVWPKDAPVVVTLDENCFLDPGGTP